MKNHQSHSRAAETLSRMMIFSSASETIRHRISSACVLWDEMPTLLGTLITDLKKKKKSGQACHIDATSRRKPSQGCWLPSISSDSPYNEHVISSRFQLEQDTNRDSCMLKCLHLRIPRRYQMRRWLRQTRLVPWQSAAGHGLELTWESICCAYHWKESGDLMIWEFRLDECSRG